MNLILPNSTIGVFGSGQLGRMFAIEARKMGYRVHTFSPGNDTPTGHISDWETSAEYDDLDAVMEFAKSVQVITYEFENVPFRYDQSGFANLRRFIRRARFCTRHRIVCERKLFCRKMVFLSRSFGI